MPSSPIGPCSSGSTTTGARSRRPAAQRSAAASSAGARRRRAGRAARAGPAAERRRRAARPAAHCAVAGDADRRRRRSASGSTARSTWAAVTHDTSCSADWPPNSTTRRMRSARAWSAASYGRVVAGATRYRVGAVRLRGDASVGGRRGDRRRAGRARRRGRRRRRSTRRPVRAGPAVRADRRRARRPRLHRRRGRRRAPRPTSRARPDRRPAPRSWSADTAAALLDARPAAPATGSPDRVVGITGIGRQDDRRRTSLAAVLGAAARAPRPTSGRSTTSSGVPLTLLNAPDDTEVLVVEMGTRGVGQIAAAVRRRPARRSASSPRWPAPTLELFGAHRRVARAKGELVEALPADGTAVLNADDARVAAMAASHRRAGVLTFGARRRRRAGRATSSSTTSCGPRSGCARRGATPTCALARARARTRSPTRWPRPPPALAVGVAARRGRRRRWRGAELSPWRMELAHGRRRRARPQRRLQRQPDVDGAPRSTRSPRCRRRRRVAVLGRDGRARADGRGASTPAIARRARRARHRA